MKQACFADSVVVIFYFLAEKYTVLLFWFFQALFFVLFCLFPLLLFFVLHYIQFVVVFIHARNAARSFPSAIKLHVRHDIYD